jgi:hypothetical protein
MADPRTFLIASPELIPFLRERIGEEEVLTFSDAEPMRALEAIARHLPQSVVLERLFAASPRGAALIGRLKADPALDACQIVIMAHDSDYRRVSPRRKRGTSGAVKAHRPRLDTGTRRAPRWRMRAGVTVAVDDEVAELVDLSVLGAQVLATQALKPRQQVEIRFQPGRTGLTVTAEVVWVKVELAGRRARYRAGVEFRRANADAVTAFGAALKEG